MLNIQKLNVDNYRDQVILQKDKDYTDFHSKNTIVFGSLIEDGWDWGRNDWKAYNVSPEAMALVRPRINEKIEDRYFTRELGQLPVSAFKRNLKSRLQDAIAQYGWVYEEAFKGLDFSATEIERFKQRETRSDYPQSLLQVDNKDYLTWGEDEEYEKTLSKSSLPLLMQFYSSMTEPDAKIIEAVEICFSQLLSRNF